jgi:hypothetical protein
MRVTSVFLSALALVTRCSAAAVVRSTQSESICFYPPSCAEHRAATARVPPPNWAFDGTGHYNVTLPNSRWALAHINQTVYDNSVAHPLIIAFHGAGATAQNQEAISDMSHFGMFIGGVDVVVVYGQALMGTNGNTAWAGAPYSTPGVNDVRTPCRIAEHSRP